MSEQTESMHWIATLNAEAKEEAKRRRAKGAAQNGAEEDGDDDLVFCHPHTGGPLDHSKVLKRFKDALGGAGVRRVRFHDLRHTSGTQMAAAGVPMRTLQEWLGHRDIKTTMIYADYQASDQERELVERAFAGINSGINLSTSRNKSKQENVPENA